MQDLIFDSTSDSMTQKFAKKLAKHLKQGDCLALIGDFGAGKTTFVKGLAKGLRIGCDQYVSSPSFVILKVYQGKLPLYHFDLYRLSHLKDFDDIGLDEFLSGRGVSVVEWADRTENLHIPWGLRIEFIVSGQSSRRLKLYGRSARLKKILKNIKL
jgi:tRNA threonylcarbamoyladenosine biosynthesis protein TsaE